MAIVRPRVRISYRFPAGVGEATCVVMLAALLTGSEGFLRLRLDSWGAMDWNVGPVVGLVVTFVGSSITVSSTTVLGGSALATSTVFSPEALLLSLLDRTLSGEYFYDSVAAACSTPDRDGADCAGACCAGFASCAATAAGLLFSTAGCAAVSTGLALVAGLICLTVTSESAAPPFLSFTAADRGAGARTFALTCATCRAGSLP